ncbi:MAG: cysteine--tRNA ligase [Candidatus Micrarchaeota archaeon]|nr:cysteine--tRNA ligase [Candidatus Micrarchaeota archaeon]
MKIYLYDTYEKRLREFKEVDKGKINMYVCGITPYDYTHIGHARTYCSFDVLKRFFLILGYDVNHIQNITDIDDKIINRSIKENKSWKEISEHFAKLGHDSLKKLNILSASVYPKVSEHIKEIEEIISSLIDNGYAYRTTSGIYYSVSKFSSYGKLSGQDLASIKAGARVEVDEEKKNPADFALWKFAKPNEPYWESSLGNGRPGWHIECSAMASKYSKLPLDIHGGGYDLIFPHHENEIAQSEAAFNKRFVNYWLHCGFLTIKGEKMAKSLGNFITIDELLSKYEANAVRLFFAKTHYRSQIDFNYSLLDETDKAIEGIKESIMNAEEFLRTQNIVLKEQKEAKAIVKDFYAAMANDLNTPVAVSKMFELVTLLNKSLSDKKGDIFYILYELKKMLWVLGMDYTSFYEKESITGREKELLELIIYLRDNLRKKKVYDLSDEIRTSLKKLGIELADSDEGTIIKKTK